jgi:preprotein translocase subunit SecF
MNDIYSKNYKKMVLIPLLILIPLMLCAFFFPGVKQGIDLTGGNVLIIRSNTAFSATQIEDILSKDFNLSEINVSSVNSPGASGAYIEYSKNKLALNAEELIKSAQLAIDSNRDNSDKEALAFSVFAIELLTGEKKSFDNAKTALLAAQTALSNYNEEFYTGLEKVLTEKLGLGSSVEFQRREVSPAFGKAATESGIFIISISAFALILIIFIFFRQLIPVAGIVFAMGYDILAALAGMALFNVPISLLTIATLLMVVGYSVDTDIMLTSRMLKEKEGTPGTRATASIKTGLTMNATSLAALIAMIGVSVYFNIDVVFQIALILTFGLIGDIISTWFMNASILMWFVEKVRK